ncbi:MAG TPA: hypothetical protein VFI64_01850, partial [Nitrososphaeraceae archaeon]|nr:hypothetical protein [Nitrososphaeraceae archaeon]
TYNIAESAEIPTKITNSVSLKCSGRSLPESIQLKNNMRHFTSFLFARKYFGLDALTTFLTLRYKTRELPYRREHGNLSEKITRLKFLSITNLVQVF